MVLKHRVVTPDATRVTSAAARRYLERQPGSGRSGYQILRFFAGISTNLLARQAAFDREEDAYRAIIEKKVEPGSGIVIRYEGPRATGMPELYLTTRAVCESEELAINLLLVTDGRFSGATLGRSSVRCSPEAMEGGPIALVENGDMIRFSSLWR